MKRNKTCKHSTSYIDSGNTKTFFRWLVPTLSNPKCLFEGSDLALGLSYQILFNGDHLEEGFRKQLQGADVKRARNSCHVLRCAQICCDSTVCEHERHKLR